MRGQNMLIMKHCNSCDCLKDIQDYNKLGSICKACLRLKDIEYRNKNKEKIKMQRQKHYQENRERLVETSKDWREKNPEKHKEVKEKYRSIEENKKKELEGKKLWRKNNPGKVKEQKQRYYEKYSKQPKFRIDSAIKNGIAKQIKKHGFSKNKQHWEDMIGYTISDLMQHLQNLFYLDPIITWENYGSYWHIDHIIPKSKFYYTSHHDEQFKMYWALSNLQPLEKIKNIKKGNRG